MKPRRSERHGFSPRSATVLGRANAHLARPARRRRRTFQFERLEDRLAMAGDVAMGETLASSGLSIDSNDTLLLNPPLRLAIASADTIAANRRVDDRVSSSDVSYNSYYWYNSGYDNLEVDFNTENLRLDVLANDPLYQPMVDPTIVAVDQPEQGGSLSIAEDGKSLLFTATPGFVGSMSAMYTVRIGPGENDVYKTGMYITVTRPLLAIDDWFAVDPAEGAATLDVLANESIQAGYYNPRGQIREVRIASASVGSQGGVVTVSADGKTLTYEAAAGFTGDERFTYEVQDQFGNRDEAELFVHVAAPESTPFPTYYPEELRVRMLEMAAARWRGAFGAVQPKDFYLNPIGVCDDVPYLTQTNSSYFNLAADVDASTTNTQVAGVDEPDLVETDGRYLYTLSKGRLAIVDLEDPTAMRLLSITALSTPATAMFLDNGRLTIVGSASRLKLGNYTEQSSVLVFDVEDPAEPRLVQHTTVDGHLLASRSVDGRVYLVVSEQLNAPALQTVEIANDDGTKTTRNETWEEYVARFRSTAFEAALPGYQSFDAEGAVIASGSLSAASEILKPLAGDGSNLVSLVAIDTRSDEPGRAAATTWRDGFIADDAVYADRDDIYIWSTMNAGVNDESTFIRKIRIGNPTSIDLVATGGVAGRVVDQFSFDEHDGYLRVVTTTQTRTRGWLAAEVNDLYVLEESDAELKVVGQVSDFARGESVRSVRFDGERALVVTFPDQIFNPLTIPKDPLFVIDLSDPTTPSIEGELEVPGFSTYLELINEDQLLGFGSDIDPVTGANRGVILSLFQTEGFNEPTILDQFRFELDGVEGSIALDDHRAIAYYAEQGIVTVPITWSEPIGGQSWMTRERGELWVLKIDSESGKFQLLSRIAHDTPALRSVRVGDVLLTISDDTVSSHFLSDPAEEADRIYLGDLPVRDSFTRTEDTGPWTLDVLANDRLNELGEQATIVAVTQPGARRYGSLPGVENSIGTVSIAEDGKSLVFTPAQDFFGPVSFTYTVFDEGRGLQTATVFIEVQAVPDDLEANDDTFDVEPGAQSVRLDVLANDVDPDQSQFYPFSYIDDGLYADVDVVTLGAPVGRFDVVSFGNWYAGWREVTAVSSPDHGGTVEIDEYGQSVRYTPAEGFEGSETFTYTIKSFDGRTDTATVTVRVGGTLTATTTVALAEIMSPLEEPLAGLPESDPIREVAPAERTATPAPTTEVALPPVGEVPSFAVRSDATVRDRALLPRAPLAARIIPNDLLNRSISRSISRRSGSSADDAFATLEFASEADVDGDLAEDLALDWVAFPSAG